jgi:hypothetical protein
LARLANTRSVGRLELVRGRVQVRDRLVRRKVANGVQRIDQRVKNESPPGRALVYVGR